MRANRAFQLSTTATRPAFLADEQRLERIELISIDDGEAVLFWDVPAKLAARLLRELRTDLAGMDVDAFTEKWQGMDRLSDL